MSQTAIEVYRHKPNGHKLLFKKGTKIDFFELREYASVKCKKAMFVGQLDLLKASSIVMIGRMLFEMLKKKGDWRTREIAPFKKVDRDFRSL